MSGTFVPPGYVPRREEVQRHTTGRGWPSWLDFFGWLRARRQVREKRRAREAELLRRLREELDEIEPMIETSDGRPPA